MKTFNHILAHGSLIEMRNVFSISDSFGGGAIRELGYILGFIYGAFLGYIRPYSEGWYLLSDKGERLRQKLTEKGNS